LLNPTPIARRSLLACGIGSAFLAACGRKKAPRYPGWLLVASPGEKAVAVANLERFQRLTTVPLPHAPDRLLQSGDRIFTVSAEGAELTEIEPRVFGPERVFRFPECP
jgi:hypothetical protein